MTRLYLPCGNRFCDNKYDRYVHMMYMNGKEFHIIKGLDNPIHQIV